MIKAIRGMRDLLPPETFPVAVGGVSGPGGLRPLRLPGDPSALARAHRALRPLHRRRYRYRRQGDVHLPGPQGRLPDAAPRSHRLGAAGGAGKRPGQGRRGQEALYPGAHVPLRAAPERPLPPVLPDQLRGLRRGRPGAGRRGHSAAAGYFDGASSWARCAC